MVATHKKRPRERPKLDENKITSEWTEVFNNKIVVTVMDKWQASAKNLSDIWQLVCLLNYRAL